MGLYEDYIKYMSEVHGYDPNNPETPSTYNAPTYAQWLKNYPSMVAKQGYFEVPTEEQTKTEYAEDPTLIPFNIGQTPFGKFAPGTKISVDKNGWYKSPEGSKDYPKGLSGKVYGPGDYFNIITGRAAPAGSGITAGFGGEPLQQQGSSQLLEITGGIAKALQPAMMYASEPKGGIGGLIGQVGKMAGVVGTGGTTPTDSFAATQVADDASMTGWQTISPSDYAATAAGEDWSMGSAVQGNPLIDMAGNFIKNQAINYAKNYAKKALLKVIGGEESKGGWQQYRNPKGFSIDDSPLADKFSKNEDTLDNIFKMTGETGDIGTAMAASKAYETGAIQSVELEKEIFKYSGDPDYQVIEPELRVAAEEALQKGMSPKQATAYAFEEAKRERGFREFIKEFQMRKKLELAGISKEEESGLVNPIAWKEEMINSKKKEYSGAGITKYSRTPGVGINSQIRNFIPEPTGDATEMDPVLIQEYLRRRQRQGISL